MNIRSLQTQNRLPRFLVPVYRGTSLKRKRTPLVPYRRPMPRVLGGSWGGWAFSYGRGTPVLPPAARAPLFRLPQRRISECEKVASMCTCTSAHARHSLSHSDIRVPPPPRGGGRQLHPMKCAGGNGSHLDHVWREWEPENIRRRLLRGVSARSAQDMGAEGRFHKREQSAPHRGQIGQGVNMWRQHRL